MSKTHLSRRVERLEGRSGNTLTPVPHYTAPDNMTDHEAYQALGIDPISVRVGVSDTPQIVGESKVSMAALLREIDGKSRACPAWSEAK